MSEEEKVKALGEYYLKISSVRDKDVIINTVNKFINNFPKFKPIIDINAHRSYFTNYCIANNMSLLDQYYFLNNIPYNIKGGNNDICICVDNNNVKHVLLKRGIYTEPKEMSNKLGIDTLRSIYRATVLNIVNPLLLYRNIKDIKAIADNFKEGNIVKYSFSDSSRTVYYLVKNIKFKHKIKLLQFTAKTIEINSNTNNVISNTHTEDFRSFCDIPSILKFLDYKNLVSIDEVNKAIHETFDKRLEAIEKERNSILSNINKT